MSESQRTEWKESWRDEHLKHLCAFANSQGGNLFVGIRDDGTVTGVRNSKRLLEDIPNKAVQLLGITIAGELHRREDKEVLEIVVPPSSVPISLYGRFYIRSGSTVQELHGHELRDFILRKDNTTWDEIIVAEASIADLDKTSIKRFATKAAQENRLPYDAANDDPAAILRKLDLMRENGELTRAAVLLFGKRPRKYIRSAVVKIGRFGHSPADLISHDVIEGNLLDMPDTIMTILRTKYLHSPISYEGLERKERLEYPEKALRETILNAIVHRDYGVDTDITISIFAERIVIWNFGALLPPLSVEMLKKEHPSRRRNSLIAEAFFRAGHIEAWGRGIAKMIDECRKGGLPEPTIEEYADGIRVSFQKGEEKGTNEGKGKSKSKEKRKEKSKGKSSKEKILEEMTKNSLITIRELAHFLDLSIAGVEKNIRALKTEGLLRRVGPDKGGHWDVLKK